MRFSLNRATCAAVAVLAFMTGVTSADPLIDNLAEPIRDVTPLGVEGEELIWAAQSFSTPARVQLNSIALMVGRLIDSPEIVAELRVGDDPTGTLLATLGIPTITPGEVEPADFPLDTSVVLEPGSKYWIVLYTVAAGSFGWSYADTNQWIGDGALLDYWYSFDSGGLWSSFGYDFPYMVSIDVSAIVCSADLNGDGLVDFSDYLEFLNLYDAEDPRVDFNMDGIVDFSDYLEFLNLYDAGCP